MASDLQGSGGAMLSASPVGERTAWMLDRLAVIHQKGIGAVDVTALHCRQIQSQPGDDEHCAWLWEQAARRLGPGRVVEVHPASPFQTAVLVEVNPERRFWLNVFVEPEAPHKLDRWNTTPALPAGVEVRRLEPDDAAALARLERQAPMVLGDTTVRFDHDDDAAYLEVWALRNDPGGVVSTQDGEVIASLQASTVPMRIDGRIYNINYAHRIRTHPAKLGYGLINQMTRVGLQHKPLGESMDGIMAAIDRRNEAMLSNGWINRPGEWPNPPVRLVFDAAELGAGSAAAEPCDWADRAGEIIDTLNSTHDGDEGFIPYTADSFTERLTRAAHLYGDDSIYANEHAVIGVWEAGNRVRTIVTTPDGESVQRRAVVADWGVQSGKEAALEHLLRQVAARLVTRGLTHITVYTSTATPAWDTLSRLACSRDDFHMWTPPVMPPAGGAQRGTYVEPLAF